jgi:hypothetical protein
VIIAVRAAEDDELLDMSRCRILCVGSDYHKSDQRSGR